jgi:hypothetical protein
MSFLKLLCNIIYILDQTYCIAKLVWVPVNNAWYRDNKVVLDTRHTTTKNEQTQHRKTDKAISHTDPDTKLW